MINSENSRNKSASITSDGGEINLLDIAIVMAKNKKTIFFSVIMAMIVAVVLSLLMPNQYTAKTQILPPQSQSASGALLGALGNLTGEGLGLKNPSDVYMGVLQSRTVADALIKKFNLASKYGRKFDSDARNDLKNASSIVNGKANLISIEVTDVDPVLAKDLANAYVVELQKMTMTLALTEASQRRVFFERQFQQAKNALANAEVELKNVQKKTGVIKLSEQAEGAIKSAAAIKAKIAEKEVGLGVIKTFTTVNNPEYVRLQQEIIGLRGQLEKIEIGSNFGKGDISVSTSSIPEIGLEYTRRVRDVKYQETIFEMMAKQFELAKIDEAKQGSIVQVLDGAIVPDKKSKPTRSMIVIFFGMMAAFIAILWIYVKEASSKIKDDPNNAERFLQLKRFMSFRKN